MFSTDAAFDLGPMYSFISARKLAPDDHFYLIRVRNYGDRDWMIRTFRIDARGAVADLMAVDCGDDFDCDASTNFATTVEVEIEDEPE